MYLTEKTDYLQPGVIFRMKEEYIVNFVSKLGNREGIHVVLKMFLNYGCSYDNTVIMFVGNKFHTKMPGFTYLHFLMPNGKIFYFCDNSNVDKYFLDLFYTVKREETKQRQQ